MKAIIIGASGLIGYHLLQGLLSSTEYTSVIILIRKKLPIDHPKLQQIIYDFDLANDVFVHSDIDVCFCTLGTTMKTAGSKEAFIKVDYTYPLAFAQLCKKHHIAQFHLVTAMGADAKSGIFYNSVKGKLESEFIALELTNLNIYRPSMLLGNRSETRIGEKIGQVLMQMLDFAFIGSLKKYRAIKGITVSNAMINQSLKKETGLHIFESDLIENIGSK